MSFYFLYILFLAIWIGLDFKIIWILYLKLVYFKQSNKNKTKYDTRNVYLLIDISDLE